MMEGKQMTVMIAPKPGVAKPKAAAIPGQPEA